MNPAAAPGAGVGSPPQGPAPAPPSTCPASPFADEDPPSLGEPASGEPDPGAEPEPPASFATGHAQLPYAVPAELQIWVPDPPPLQAQATCAPAVQPPGTRAPAPPSPDPGGGAALVLPQPGAHANTVAGERAGEPGRRHRDASGLARLRCAVCLPCRHVVRVHGVALAQAPCRRGFRGNCDARSRSVHRPYAASCRDRTAARGTMYIRTARTAPSLSETCGRPFPAYFQLLVRRRGLEPLRCYPLAPQASASANSATFAWCVLRRRTLSAGEMRVKGVHVRSPRMRVGSGSDARRSGARGGPRRSRRPRRAFAPGARPRG